jgi:long-chain acyl-CoA synthetase
MVEGSEPIRSEVDPDKIPRSVHETLERSAADFPDRSLIIFGGYSFTYRQIDFLTSRFAAALISLGLHDGDRVACFLPSSPQFVIAFYGALKAGGVLVPIDHRFRELELRHMISDSGSKIVVTMDSLFEKFTNVIETAGATSIVLANLTPEELGSLRRLSTKEVIGVQGQQARSPFSFLEMIDSSTSLEHAATIDPFTHLAALPYTTGTTGSSKGVMLSHFNLLANQYQFNRALKNKIAKETALVIFPFSHIGGLNAAMGTLVHSCNTIIAFERFDVMKVMASVAVNKPTLFYGTPTAYVSLLAHQDALSKVDFACVRVALSSGSPLPQEVKKKFADKTGVIIVDTWGMTESSPVLTCSPLGEMTKANEIGHPVFATEVRVGRLTEDNQDGDLIEEPVNEAGELIARGPQVMLGYWNKPEATAQTIRNGWLYSGDLGYIDSGGSVFYLDRKKDIVNVGGLKVWPAEVEGVLYESPFVAEVVVGPKRDEKYGEVVAAWVVLKPSVLNAPSEIEKSLKEFCATKLAQYKVPTSISFVTEIPKTPVGKPLRRIFRESSS